MMIWMRDSAFAGVFKFLMFAVLLMAVVGLIFLDIGGFFRNGGVSPNTVAKGDGVNIGIEEFDRTLRRVLASQNIPPADAYRLGVVNGVLTSEIQNRLFTIKAHDLGLMPDDESVKRQISRMATALAARQGEGASKKEILQQVLRAQGLSEKDFVGLIRNETANGLLRAAVSTPPTLGSPMMASTLWRYDNETRGADIVVLKNSDIKDAAKPTDEQLEKYYEANKVSYLIPETRTVTMATLKSDMLAKTVTVSDDDVRKEYDKDKDSLTKPEQRTVRQIVLKTEEEAKKTADDMKAGNIPPSALTQDYDEKSFAPEIGKPVFAAKVGDVVGPVKSALGWHVAKVTAITPSAVEPFESASKRIREDLQATALNDQMYQAATAIDDRIAGGDKLDDIVKEYGMTTETIGPFRSNGNGGKDFKDDLFKAYGNDGATLTQAAFDTDKGEIAPLVETADGQFRLVRVDGVTPDGYRPLAEVKADLAAKWMAEQQKLANKVRAQKALDDLNAGKSLSDVAKANGGTVQSFAKVKRNELPPQPLTPVATAQIFTAEKGKGFSTEGTDGFIVGVVTNVALPPAPAKDEKDFVALTDLTGRSLPDDALGVFVNKIADGHEVRVNTPLLEKTYGPKAQEAEQQ